MTAARPAAGGGRWLDVPPARLQRWLDGFAERHGEPVWAVTPDCAVATAPDGAVAECTVPFPPLAATAGVEEAAYGGLVDHALLPRRIGVLLVRLGGFAVGLVDRGRLVSAKTGSRPVHGRAAAGGWSQQRFARRREGQARVALDAAAQAAARLLVPQAGDLDGIRVGGDRRAIDSVLTDGRLAPLGPLVTGPLLDVPDPRRRVLDDVLPSLAAVRVHLREPTAEPA